MYPNSYNNFNNVNPNYIPNQYPPPNQNQYAYFNPYQNQQPMIPNMQNIPQMQNMQNIPNIPQMQPMQPMQPMPDQQFYIQPQQMQPMYFPYMPQQPMYNPMFIPQNPNMHQNPNMYQQNQQNQRHNKQQQNQRRPPHQQHQQHQQQHQYQQQPQPQKKIKSEIDPSKPEHSKEEIMKWIEQRKRNFPSKANLARKELERKLKEETGEIVEPALSILESKLRRRIRVLGMIDGKQNRKKEFERNYLLKYVTNPYKKVKTTTLGVPGNEEKAEKPEEEAEAKKVEEEKKEPEEKKDVYDAFKEFQMQINLMEDEQAEDGEIREKKGEGDDDEPVERKIITEKHLEERRKENNGGERHDNRGKRESYKDKKIPKKLLPKKIKKTPKPEGEEVEGGEKKTESIDDIIANLRQRKDKDDQEFSKVLEGNANTADFKYRSNTLLANLLIDTIYHEKNAILQCLRYIVREDFFDNR